MSKFRLNKEEIAREIHHLLKEAYADRDIDGQVIAEFISDMSDDNGGLVFDIGGYCKKCGMEPGKTAGRLMYDLDVELEKNLHDKMLFGINLNGNKIEFREEAGNK